jgi:hypothetical protein
MRINLISEGGHQEAGRRVMFALFDATSTRPKEFDARKLDVSNASKETCNLCQATFVGLYFSHKKIG